jgi:uncharacterized protein (TIGR02594 family)
MLPDRFAYLAAAGKPAWLSAAIGQLGVAEVSGAKSNPRILDYRKIGKTPLGGDDGAVAWCAIFVNAMLEKSEVAGSASAMARSYVRHAAFERLTVPMVGCIAVKSSSRGPSSGHVGFYVGEDGAYVYLLGGNQSDSVNISAFRKAEFVGYFWPKGQPKPPAPFDKPYRLAVAGRASQPVREA